MTRTTRSRQSAAQRLSGSAQLSLGGAAGLPAPVTSFVGRQEAITHLVALLESQRDQENSDPNAGSCWLVTLTGPGGCGKSRLALAVAARLQPFYSDGARLVELAAVPAGAEASSIEQAVATALGLARGTSRPSLATLIGALQDRNVLLILDNLDHVAAACRAPVAALLRACSGLRILATSREALNIAGEWVWPVPPLSLTSGDEASAGAGMWERSEAVTLFVERTRTRVPNFTLTLETGSHSCRHLPAPRWITASD